MINVRKDVLHQQGLTNVQSRLITVEYTAKRPSFSSFVESNRLVFRTIRPFLQKWTKLPDNYDQLMQQAVADMADPGFEASFQLRTVWGTNTQVDDKVPMTQDYH